MALGTACLATSSELQHLGIRARCGDQRPFSTATHPYQELYQTGSPHEPIVSTQGDASASSKFATGLKLALAAAVRRQALFAPP